MTHGITRRRMLAASAAAAAGAAIGGDYGGASAQGAKRIEQLAPELDKIIDTNEPINQLASGVGGATGRPKARCGGRRAAISCLATSTVIGA